MEKIYQLMDDDYDSAYVVGTYSTAEKALDALNSLRKTHFIMQVFIDQDEKPNEVLPLTPDLYEIRRFGPNKAGLTDWNYTVVGQCTLEDFYLKIHRIGAKITTQSGNYINAKRDSEMFQAVAVQWHIQTPEEAAKIVEETKIAAEKEKNSRLTEVLRQKAEDDMNRLSSKMGGEKQE